MGKDKEKLLSEVKKRMQKDDDLPLKKGATNLVFGNGDPDSLILFIGEGPGFWEDKKGIPFVGNAGSFLNQLLYSIKLPREQVFITNIVHYRYLFHLTPIFYILGSLGMFYVFNENLFINVI